MNTAAALLSDGSDLFDELLLGGLEFMDDSLGRAMQDEREVASLPDETAWNVIIHS